MAMSPFTLIAISRGRAAIAPAVSNVEGLSPPALFTHSQHQSRFERLMDEVGE